MDCKVFIKTIAYVLKTEGVQEGKQEGIKKEYVCEYEKFSKEEGTHNMPQ